jgi:hypothetical protein
MFPATQLKRNKQGKRIRAATKRCALKALWVQCTHIKQRVKEWLRHLCSESQDDHGVQSKSEEMELMQKAMMYSTFVLRNCPRRLLPNQKNPIRQREESHSARKEFASRCHSDQNLFRLVHAWPNVTAGSRRLNRGKSARFCFVGCQNGDRGPQHTQAI